MQIVTVNNIGGSVSQYLMGYGRGLYVCRQLIDNVIAKAANYIHQCTIFDEAFYEKRGRKAEARWRFLSKITIIRSCIPLIFS